MKLFEREAQVLANLNHSRIPRYRDYFSLDRQIGEGLPWFGIVQDYIPGASLQELLEQGKRFSEKQVKSIATQVLDILIYLHSLSPPVLHRDIKPSNLILTEDEQIYLVDFGAVQDKAAFTGVTFTVVGTSGYSPLEQFWGRAVPASDLYALGASLIHLLTGIAPADLPQKDARIQFSDRITLNPSFVTWIEQLTEISIEKRFSTAKEALQGLKSGIYRPSRGTYTRKIPEPFTFIKLSKSAEKMEIHLTSGGTKQIERFGCFGLIFFLSFWTFIFSLILFIIVWVNPIIGLTMFAFFGAGLAIFFGKQTHIYFDRKRFEIVRQAFNFTYSSRKGNVEDILGVFLTLQGWVYEVCIRTEDGFYQLGGALDEDEATWLAQEIQDWLNLKI
ncbi:serine/threonine protein kinase [Microseira wollei]|uniref:Serine/threonine protein kinase n=1 Tax=Microseira wollei NIES-4236 TaxID=2530354 RepID=A0AAV3X7B4_9CYAN|nr:serine/threonine-protein kinase [Microseira wollei]GET38243.1 serine/threonine protein kinase [Microseira wollei NIES-4236]